MLSLLSIRGRREGIKWLEGYKAGKPGIPMTKNSALKFRAADWDTVWGLTFIIVTIKIMHLDKIIKREGSESVKE